MSDLVVAARRKGLADGRHGLCLTRFHCASSGGMV